MVVTSELQQRLRLMLNDKVTTDGVSTFSNDEIDQLIQESPNIYRSAAVGWTLKAALLQANIEKYGVGQETYDLTSLKDQYQHALSMSNQYSVLSQEESRAIEKPRLNSRFLKVKRPEVL